MSNVTQALLEIRVYRMGSQRFRPNKFCDEFASKFRMVIGTNDAEVEFVSDNSADASKV